MSERFEVGEWVTWTGQENQVVRERIVKITEPQPGNYVLWTTLFGGKETAKQWLFPINAKGVRRAEAKGRGEGRGVLRAESKPSFTRVL